MLRRSRSGTACRPRVTSGSSGSGSAVSASEHSGPGRSGRGLTGFCGLCSEARFQGSRSRAEPVFCQLAKESGDPQDPEMRGTSVAEGKVSFGREVVPANMVGHHAWVVNEK